MLPRSRQIDPIFPGGRTLRLVCAPENAPRQQIEHKETEITKFLFECPAHSRRTPAQEPLRFLGYLLLKLFSKISTQIEQKETKVTKFLSISVESIRAFWLCHPMG